MPAFPNTASWQPSQCCVLGGFASRAAASEHRQVFQPPLTCEPFPRCLTFCQFVSGHDEVTAHSVPFSRPFKPALKAFPTKAAVDGAANDGAPLANSPQRSLILIWDKALADLYRFGNLVDAKR